LLLPPADSGHARRRDVFLAILNQVRQRYRFVVVGYVVMPEHFHLLMFEPERATPSTVMQVLKQRFARRLHGRRKLEDRPSFGPRRSWVRCGRRVWSAKKEREKLRYMHRNPVVRRLVQTPEEWRWSSFRSYAYGEPGMVRINFQEWPCKVSCRGGDTCATVPALSQRAQKDGAPHGSTFQG
jgi:putative transposase